MKAFLNKSAQGRLIYRQSEHPVAEAVFEIEAPERLLSGRPFGPKGTLQIDTMSDTFYPEHIMDQPFRHP